MTILFSILAAVILLAIGIGTWWYLDYTKDDGLIYSNVYAFHVNLGGMTPEEAKAAIHSATDRTFKEQTLTVNLPDETLLFSPETTQISVDVDRLVTAAYDYGRSGSRWARTMAKQEAALSEYELNAREYMTINTTAIQDILNSAAEAAESQLVQTTVTVDGTVPDLNRTIEDAADDTETEHMMMTIVLGTPYRHLDTGALMETILRHYESNSFEPIDASYEVTQPDNLDLEALSAEYCVQPVDAILNEETYEITPEVLGYGFVIEDLQQAIQNAEPGATIEYPLGYLPAAVTKASLEEHLFKDTLASVDTNHVRNSNRTRNLELACQAINNTIVRPGEVFSFNNTVGQRTAAKGYKPAAVFSGGLTENEVGGGICQVASTIYYAALQADLEIVERTEHAFVVDYVPLGMDATIYWGSLDFKFRNNTNYPIRIKASVSGGQVHVSLIGTDEKDYYVKMTYETVSGPNYGATKYKVYPKGNSEGYSDGQTIQTAYNGRTVKSYRVKYSKATDTQISSAYEATSTYSKRDKIICVIGDPNAPTDSDGKPIETTTEATRPATTTPTQAPTQAPTDAPTEAPTEAPTQAPTQPSTEAPTQSPTEPAPPSEPAA